MKLLRFRYMLPVSLFVIVDLILIAYAAVDWDSDPEGVWHGPNMTSPLDDSTATYTLTDDFSDYGCPPAPPPSDGGGDGGGGDGGGGDGGDGGGGGA